MKKKNSPGKASRAAEVVGLGGAFVDFSCPVSDDFIANLPDGGGKGSTVHCGWEDFQALLAQLPQEEVQMRCGGGVGTTLRRLSKEGAATLMVSAVGDDSEGRMYLECLKAEGVDTRRVSVVPGEHTGLCISLFTPDGERTMRTFRGINDNFSKYVALRPSDLDNAIVLYSEGYLLAEEAFVQKSLALAKDMGVDVVFDVGSSNVVIAHQAFFRNVLPSYASVVLANHDEATALTGNPDPRQAVLLMSELYDSAYVKCGADGVVYLDDERIPQNEPVSDEGKENEQELRQYGDFWDTTGAGDAWAAGFIFAYIWDASVESAVKLANVIAALYLSDNAKRRLELRILLEQKKRMASEQKEQQNQIES